MGEDSHSDNLRRRGYTIANWLCMCRFSVEIVNHLLIHYGALFLNRLGSLGCYQRE